MRILKFYLVAIAILGQTIGWTQILTPAEWTYTVSSTEVKIGDEIEVIFTAKLDPTWYMYSSDQDPEVGPWPTVFEFEPNDTFKLSGGIDPVDVKEKFDKTWKGKVRFMEKKAEFRQKITILKPNPEIFVMVEYQVCTTVDGVCVAGDEEFEISDMIVVK